MPIDFFLRLRAKAFCDWNIRHRNPTHSTLLRAHQRTQIIDLLCAKLAHDLNNDHRKLQLLQLSVHGTVFVSDG